MVRLGNVYYVPLFTSSTCQEDIEVNIQNTPFILYYLCNAQFIQEQNKEGSSTQQTYR